MKEMLAHGLKWPTKPITEEDRADDLIEAQIRKAQGHHNPTGITPEISVGQRQVWISPTSSPQKN
jgi:hypothetical protein